MAWEDLVLAWSPDRPCLCLRQLGVSSSPTSLVISSKTSKVSNKPYTFVTNRWLGARRRANEQIPRAAQSHEGRGRGRGEAHTALVQCFSSGSSYDGSAAQRYEHLPTLPTYKHALIRNLGGSPQHPRRVGLVAWRQRTPVKYRRRYAGYPERAETNWHVVAVHLLS